MDTEQITSTAEVATQRPGRYARQLISHMSRKAQGAWDEDRQAGEIRFATSTCTLTSRDGALALALTVSADEAERMEGVVGRHLVRFGASDELRVEWVRSDGTPGTSQVNDADEEGERPGSPS